MYGNAAMCPFLKKGGTGELEDSPDHGSESDPEFAKCLPLARRTEVIIPHLLQPVLVNSRPVLAHQKPAFDLMPTKCHLAKIAYSRSAGRAGDVASQFPVYYASNFFRRLPSVRYGLADGFVGMLGK